MLTGPSKALQSSGRQLIGNEWYRWDYVQNRARKESEMTKAEIEASKKAKGN